MSGTKIKLAGFSAAATLLLAIGFPMSSAWAEPAPLNQPSVSLSGPASVVVGQPISVDAELIGGDEPTGTLTFRTYDPALPSCTTQPVVFSSTVSVSGNGTYESTEYLTEAAGTYLWTVEYSGDSNNQPATSTCNAAGSTSEVAKAQPILDMTDATMVGLGGEISASANLSGGFRPGGEVIFNAFGPEDPNCSGLPAFASDWIPVDAAGDFTSPGFKPKSLGDYNWRFFYSGDPNNEPVSTSCGERDSISYVTIPAPTCRPVKLGFRISTFEPNRRAINRQIPGIRILMNTNFKVWTEFTATFVYWIDGERRVARLRTDGGGVDKRRRMLIRIPNRMAKQLRQDTGRVSGNPVIFRMKARLLLKDENYDCGQWAGTKTVKTRITGVSEKLAIRRK